MYRKLTLFTGYLPLSSQLSCYVFPRKKENLYEGTETGKTLSSMMSLSLFQRPEGVARAWAGFGV